MYHKPTIPKYLVNLIAAIILPTRLFGFKRWLYRDAGVTVGVDVKITSECRIYGNGTISIGHGTWLARGTDFLVPVPAHVFTGERCDMSSRVRFLCETRLVGDASRRAGAGVVEDLYIGSGVWVGARSVLLPGAYLEDGIMEAAGSVVVKGRYFASSLLADSPAKVKKIYE